MRTTTLIVSLSLLLLLSVATVALATTDAPPAGLPLTVVSVSVEGAVSFAPEDLLAVLATQPGDEVLPGQLWEDRTRLQDYYQTRGLVLKEVQVLLDAEGMLTFALEEEPPPTSPPTMVTVAASIVSGNDAATRVALEQIVERPITDEGLVLRNNAALGTALVMARSQESVSVREVSLATASGVVASAEFEQSSPAWETLVTYSAESEAWIATYRLDYATMKHSLQVDPVVREDGLIDLEVRVGWDGPHLAAAGTPLPAGALPAASPAVEPTQGYVRGAVRALGPGEVLYMIVPRDRLAVEWMVLELIFSLEDTMPASPTPTS
jgi:hypothetical protein